MSFLQILRVASRALLRNKLRSMLTTLGVIIGVGAVIAMVSIGEGAKSQVERAFQSMGSNLIIVMSGTSHRGGAFGGMGSMPSLTWDDLKAIQTEAPAVRVAAAVMQANGQLTSDEQNWNTNIVGSSADYFAIRNWPTVKGTAFSPTDVDSGNKVVVLGQTVVEKLFGVGFDPVGQTIRIKNIPFQVTGVLDRKGQSPMGQDNDDTVVIPYTAFLSKIRGGLQKFIAGVIFISAVSADAANSAQSQVTNILRDRHHIDRNADDDFSIRNLSEVAAAQQQGTKTLTTLLASIAAVSLLVGGIGIMNIMLVSVTERTREIGIRMAVGARPRDILSQFLVEALTLSVAGGIIGVAMGLLTARQLASSFNWPLLIRPDVIAISMGFAALVGVVFGLYPAWKASRLDPIEALRYE
ncbi:MAG: ABC transporter permease [Deltaproteobacteria bacterium]|nr:ABC transporter permease [Deltaproteobacteria bacterium]